MVAWFLLLAPPNLILLPCHFHPYYSPLPLCPVNTTFPLFHSAPFPHLHPSAFDVLATWLLLYSRSTPQTVVYEAEGGWCAIHHHGWASPSLWSSLLAGKQSMSSGSWR